MMQDFTLSRSDVLTVTARNQAQSSRTTDKLKRAFRDVLRAFSIQPYIDIPPKPSRACMGFCDVLTGIKKALASRQKMPPKLALSPIECQHMPYYLVDYRINSSEKNPGVCVIFKNFRQSA